MSTPTFSPQPVLALHHQVKQDLLLRLRSGNWPPGTEIPPEPALCAHYRVSRGTLRRAIGDLVNEGYLERYRGRGTFVSPPKLESRFAGSFGRFTVIGPSLEPRSRVLFCRRVRAAEPVAAVLGLGRGEEVWHLERVRFAGERPAALQGSYLPRSLFPELSRQALDRRFLLDIMTEVYAVPLLRAVEVVDPTKADSYAARALGIRAGTPLFRVERRTYSTAERVVEYRISVLRGDIFRYRTEFR
ncbi:MAG: GntR family transcriptional regulator [Betaproteobacteria bacterium]